MLSRRPGRPEPDVDAWISTLKLSHLWDMARAAEDAIKHLDALVTAPVARVKLAREIAIPGWQAPAFEALVLQGPPMGAAEVDVLGLDTVLKLAALREQYGTARRDLLAAELDKRVDVHRHHVVALHKLEDLHQNAVTGWAGP
jgi:hypothetical protein